MVKTPRTRHYKPARQPLTIDLAANPDSPACAPEEAKPSEFEAWDPDVPPGETAADAPVNDGSPALETEEAGKNEVADEPFDHTKGPSQDAKPAEEPRRTWTEYQPSAAAVTAPRGGLSNLAAGLIGGVSALVLAGLLQFAGVLGSPGGATGVDAEIAQLRGEVAALKSADSAQAVAGLSQAVDQIKADVASLQSTAQGAGSQDAAALGALDERIKAVEGSVSQLSQAGQGVSQETVDGLNAKVGSIEQSLAAVTGKVDAQAAQPKIAMAISAAALKSALERGGTFSAELETFAAIAPNAPEIAGLRQYAEQGVMARADIAKAFPDAANAMTEAATPADANAGFFQRLLSSAESVVKVRPVGDVAGDDPAARIARMEVAINAGDYGKALAEYAALPAEVQAAGAALMDKVKARLDADKLTDQMIAGAMKAA